MVATTQAAMVQQDSPLLSLPAEIRNHIWTLAVVQEDVIIFRQLDLGRSSPPPVGIWHSSPPGPPAPIRLPSIAQTSQRARIEALPIYLEQNIFQFHPGRIPGENDSTLSRRVFGPLFHHIEKTRRIQFKGWPNPVVHRVTRDGEWSRAEVDCLRDGVIITDDFFASKTQDRMVKILRDIMKVNADGQLHQADFVTLVRLL